MSSNNNHISPESRIVPYDDINTKQMRISGERLPEVLLELCDSCNWCTICFNKRGMLKKCPECEAEVSLISMSIDETCSIEFDERRGVTIRFDRKSPLR